MDNFRSTDWMLLMVVMLYLIMAPGTKVEESFNVQAIHDILYHRFNFSAYDHHEFPGIVPRTFVGPLAISGLVLPFIDLFIYLEIAKLWVLFLVRMILGTALVISFCNFGRCVDKHFGRTTGKFLRIITATQFHFLFYASRPLPNIFALVGVLWVYQLWMDEKFKKAVWIATCCAALFRCELILLFGSIFLLPIVSRKMPLLGYDGAIFNGLISLLLTLAVSVPVDSFFWNRFVWPEGEVWWFNVVLNKSHEYGVYPFFWYFYSALPRALLFSYALVPLGVIIERRLLYYVLPVIAFLFLYSFLPHKELRFIIYAFPLLNLAAASACAKLWEKRNKSFLWYGLALVVSAHLVGNIVGTSVFTYASSWNYPGVQAIGYLQYMQRFDRNKPISVHIDNFAAQTGVSRFFQLYDSWEYNKTEGLAPPELDRFDFLLVGSYDGKNIVGTATKNHSSTHRLLYAIKAFHKLRWQKLSRFPFYFPDVRLIDKLVVLKKLE